LSEFVTRGESLRDFKKDSKRCYLNGIEFYCRNELSKPFNESSFGVIKIKKSKTEEKFTYVNNRFLRPY